MKRIILFCSVLFVSAQGITGQSLSYKTILSSQQMNSDFLYLREKLEASAPGMFFHQSKERVSLIFDSVQQTLSQPLSLLDFYSKIAFLIAEVRCEHSYSLPSGNMSGELMKDFKFLPIQPYFAADKPFVLINGSADTSIHPGYEIISINNRPINSILQTLYRYMPGDGFITAGKDYALSSMQFSYLYNLFIERPKQYEVVFKTPAGSLITRQFTKGLDVQHINENAMKNPVNKPILEADKRGQAKRAHNLLLELDSATQTAFLTVRSFSEDESLFKHQLDSLFHRIHESGFNKLAVDLTYNSGGEEGLAAYLLSYLVKKPILYVEYDYLLTDADEILKRSNAPEDVLANKYEFIEPLRNGRSLVKPSKYAQELDTIFPRNNRFNGKVAFYVNGATASAASTCAAVAQSNQLATIIGSETAGAFGGGGVVIGLDLTLPHSGIKTHSSIVFMKFATSGRDAGRGVMPDVEYRPGLGEMVRDSKEWKMLAFQNK